jgi:tagaturonate reductase
LEPAFKQWVSDHSLFCNTLVDRIVPGTPDVDTQQAFSNRLGYQDALLTMAEVYRLFAIEGDETLVQRVPFLKADPGIIVSPDITPYRERKVRILNGTHTTMVPVALLAGLRTVREAVTDPVMGRFIRQVMLDEIVPSLDSDPIAAEEFAHAVLDRFGNPFIVHELRSITLQTTKKLGVRVVPSIIRYFEKRNRLPKALVLGFACLLLLKRGGHGIDLLHDDHADDWDRLWAQVQPNDDASIRAFVERVGQNESLWGYRLDQLPGFTDAVTDYLTQAIQDGVTIVLANCVDAA